MSVGLCSLSVLGPCQESARALQTLQNSFETRVPFGSFHLVNFVIVQPVGFKNNRSVTGVVVYFFPGGDKASGSKQNAASCNHLGVHHHFEFVCPTNKPLVIFAKGCEDFN